MSRLQSQSRTSEAMSSLLLAWFVDNRRAFPWREDASPYRVWVSEIMLQQTRIEAALPYFERFLSALPDIRTLAEADEDRLLKLWEGLGYYSRARNLQKAARVVMEHFNGSLPADYEQLLALPGIGEYTAGAIASIAFGLRVPAVDGNVLRVVARLMNDGGDITTSPVKKRLKETVAAMIPDDKPGDFNQALMELGETVCLPNTVPLCGHCPLANDCMGHLAGNPERLPVRAVKKERRTERRTVFVILSDERVLLHRRDSRGLLAGLWELPGVDGWLSSEEAVAAAARWGMTQETEAEELKPGRHIFSHVEWHMRGYRLESVSFEAPPGFLWADARQLREDFALPSAFRPFADYLPEQKQTGDL